MAIKGKTRSRGRRVVAAAPRPQLVTRKKPIWARRWVWIAIVAVAVVGVAVAVARSVTSKRHEAFLQGERDATQVYAQTLLAKFPPNAQPAPPTGYQIYPILAGDLDKIAAGSYTDAEILQRGKDLEKSAKTSGDAIAAIDVTKFIPETFTVSGLAAQEGKGATRIALIDGQYLIEQAFRGWTTVGQLMQDIAGATGAARTALVEQAKSVNDQASSLFERGWQKLVNVKTVLGIQQFEPFQPQQPGATTPAPSPSPTGKAKASPTQPSPSASK